MIDGFISHDTARKFRLLREMRNRAAHTVHFEGDESSPDWTEALSIAKDLLSGLDKAIQEDYFSKRKARRGTTENSDNSDEADSQVTSEDESKPDN